MGIWSSIRDFYRKWKPEIDLYGIGLLLLVGALMRGRMAAACIILGGVLVMDAMRRWGEPWRQLGARELERRRLANQERWQEIFGAVIMRFRRPGPLPPPPPAEAPAPPVSAEESPPESPTAPMAEPEKPAPAVIVPVTHDT